MWIGEGCLDSVAIGLYCGGSGSRGDDSCDVHP
jgi:hypothetical protein